VPLVNALLDKKKFKFKILKSPDFFYIFDIFENITIFSNPAYLLT